MSVYLADHPALVWALFAQTLALFFLSNTHRSRFAQTLLALLPLLIVLTGIGLIWSRDTLSEVSISLCRLAVMVLSALIVFSVLRPFELVASLKSMFVPAGPAFALGIGIRFLPILAEDIERVRIARRARGVGRVWQPVALLRYLLVPILFLSLERAERVAFAVQVRGITARRMAPVLPGFRSADVASLLFLLSEIALCVLW